MGTVDPAADNALEDLRKLECLQKAQIARRLARDEPVATSDINGLADLHIRIETMERMRLLRELTRAPKDLPCKGESESRSSSAGAKATPETGRSRKRSS